jgi:hypothetical protein
MVHGLAKAETGEIMILKVICSGVIVRRLCHLLRSSAGDAGVAWHIDQYFRFRDTHDLTPSTTHRP